MNRQDPNTNLFITENARFWFLYRTLKIDIGLQFFRDEMMKLGLLLEALFPAMCFYGAYLRATITTG